MADYPRNNRDKALRISVNTRRVRLAAKTTLLSALILLVALSAALAQTWTGGGGNVNWNTPGNWSTLPVSGNNTDIIFGGTTNTGTSGAPLNQNIVIPFVLNSLTFSAGSAAFFLGGNSLRFDGTNNSITQSSSNTVSIANNFLAPTVNGTSNLLLTGNGTGVVTLSGAITGGNGQRDYAMTKTGTSTFVLTGPSSFDGAVTINAGVLNIQNANALGSTAAGTTVASGAALQLQGGITVTGETLSLNGSGIANDGALRNISGNNSYAGTITQAAASRINSDSGTLTLSAVNTGGFALTLGGAGNVSVNGVISGAAGSLIKNDAGTVTLSAANTFTGATTVNSGTLLLAPAAGSALAATSSVTVNSGGTLMLGANNQINNTAPMTLAGGTFAKGNFSEGSASTPGVGALTLTAAGSHIDFGTGTVGVLTFASLTPGAFKLTIDNWTGTANTVGGVGTDRLIFNSDQSANLSSFQFTGFAAGAVEFSLAGGFFEVVPVAVPETSTWLAAALAVGIAGVYLLRRRRCKGQDTEARFFARVQFLRLAALTTLLLPVLSAQATDRHWTGGTSTSWNTNSNWSSRPPDTNDNAVFDRVFLFQPNLTTAQTIGGILMSGSTVPDVTISSNNVVLSLRGVAGNGTAMPGLLVTNTNGSRLTITTDLQIVNSQSWLNNSNNVVNIFGGVDLSNNALTIGGPGNFQVDGVISNSGLLGTDSVTLIGTGTRAFTGTNTYDGLTLVNGGTLIISNNFGLGITTSGTVVASGAQLQLQGGITIGTEALTLNGTGNAADLTTGAGALRNISGNNSFGGQITLGSNSTIISGNNTLTLSGGIQTAGFTVTFGGDSTISSSGAINGTGGLIKNDPGTLILNGANGYSGGSTINGGTVVIQNNASLGDPTGTATLNSATIEVSGTTSSSRNFVLGSATSTFLIDNGVTFTPSGGFSGTGTLNKNGAGTMVLGGANTFTGETKVNLGTLTLSASSGSALGTTSKITVNSGGTVMLGANNQINNTAPMTLAGGTFAKGNFNEGSASTPGIGALTLTAAGSHIDFGTGTAGVLTFASFTPGSFTLAIDNWTGTAGVIGSGSTDRLIFNSDQSANLSAFSFTGFGPGAFELDLGNGSFEITPVPVPEPSTWMAAAMSVAVAGWCFTKSRRRPQRPAHSAARNRVFVICGCALLSTPVLATPREEIVRAVEANTPSGLSQAAPRQFLKAFAVVALRADPGDLPDYVTAAIHLRPDLTLNTVTVAVKIAAKNGEEKPQTLCTAIDAIVKAAIAAKPDAVVPVAEAAAYGLPQFRDCVVNAAIAAAPGAKEAIEEAVGLNNIPRAFLTMSPTDNGLWYTSASLNAASISKPEVISPEQPSSD